MAVEKIREKKVSFKEKGRDINKLCREEMDVIKELKIVGLLL